eukprot:7323984-Pyramimonas_sp.AAC.1
MLGYAAACHEMSCYAMLCHVRVCDVATPCVAIPRHEMLSDAMLCHAIRRVPFEDRCLLRDPTVRIEKGLYAIVKKRWEGEVGRQERRGR